MKEFPELDRDGIEEIKKANQIEFFDLVLIDGSEFTGSAELNDVYGAKIICLDDVNSFKCYPARQRLLADATYELLYEDLNLRNGYSIFCRTDYWGAWRTAKHAALNAVPLPSRRQRIMRKVRRIFRRIRYR